MTKFGKLVLTIILIIIFSVIIFFLQKKPPVVITENSVKNNTQDKIVKNNNSDLVSFSILPNSKVNGVVSYEGVIKGGYFFEGNILVGVASMDKKIILQNNATATTEWMTSEPVSFKGSIDFTGLPKGSAYIEIHNDNASGLPENDKIILIPIIIE